MPTTTKPIDSKKKERYAELIGLGCTHAEAAGAVGISVRAGERFLAQPEYRKIADETRRGRGVSGELGAVIRDLLQATYDNGQPNHALRSKGAELALARPRFAGHLGECSVIMSRRGEQVLACLDRRAVAVAFE